MSVLDGLDVIRIMFPGATLPASDDLRHNEIVSRLNDLARARRPVTQVEFVKLMDTLGLSVVDGVVRVG